MQNRDQHEKPDANQITPSTVLAQFAANGLHGDLPADDRVALATEIASLQARGYAVDLQTCWIVID